MTLPVQPKYSIGQTVYGAYANYEQVRQTCPHCLGSKEWSVKTPAGEEFSIPCHTCEEGWFSTGSIRIWKDAPRVETLTIGSIRIDTHDERSISYMCQETGIGSGSIHYEDLLFMTYKEALEVATEQAFKNATARTAEQREREAKEKKKSRNKPSWERRQIKELERELKTTKDALALVSSKPIDGVDSAA
jgi:hypothetical protein